jgi:hypothetical protein
MLSPNQRLLARARTAAHSVSLDMSFLGSRKYEIELIKPIFFQIQCRSSFFCCLLCTAGGFLCPKDCSFLKYLFLWVLCQFPRITPSFSVARHACEFLLEASSLCRFFPPVSDLFVRSFREEPEHEMGASTSTSSATNSSTTTAKEPATSESAVPTKKPASSASTVPAKTLFDVSRSEVLPVALNCLEEKLMPRQQSTNACPVSTNIIESNPQNLLMVKSKTYVGRLPRVATDVL